MSATGAADADANVVRGHILCRQCASTLGKGRREHHVGMVSIFIGICVTVSYCKFNFEKLLTTTRHNLLQILGPVCVEHFVRFVDDSVPSKFST